MKKPVNEAQRVADAVKEAARLKALPKCTSGTVPPVKKKTTVKIVDYLHRR